MVNPATIIELLLAGCVLAATAFYLLAMIAAYRFFALAPGRDATPAQSENIASINLPPVSIMIPLAGADFNAYQNYARFCDQDYQRTITG